MKFYDYLSRIKTNGYFANSLIIKNNYCCDYLALSKMYLKALVCKQQIPFCNECFYCNKINNNAYVDFIYLDNNELNKINKEDIINIQQKFIYPSTEEANIKLYVIANIDQANKQVVNSLLKFIEDSPKNTYNLFFCTNPNSILKTILSRSNLITIQDKIDFHNINHSTLIQKIFNDFDQYEKFVNEYNLNQLIEWAYLLNDAKIDEQIKIAKSISSITKYEFLIFLRIILEIINIEYKQKIINFISDFKLNMNQKNVIINLIELINSKY